LTGAIVQERARRELVGSDGRLPQSLIVSKG